MNSEFENEVREKWGKTDAYKEYESKNHSKQRLSSLSEGLDRIMAEFALCKQSATPDSDKAQNLVKKLQNYITENYYRCTDEILANLGQMYVADERFRNNIDKHADGTAAFIRDAIQTYCKAP